jgi:DNA-binding transcriptional LysR family regulator
VLYRPEFALHGHILEACRSSGFQPTVVAESSHWDFIVAMVAANIGLALLPVTVCRLLDRRQVRSVRLSEPVIPWDAALIWRRDGQKSPATRASRSLWRDVQICFQTIPAVLTSRGAR